MQLLQSELPFLLATAISGMLLAIFLVLSMLSARGNIILRLFVGLFVVLFFLSGVGYFMALSMQ